MAFTRLREYALRGVLGAATASAAWAAAPAPAQACGGLFCSSQINSPVNQAAEQIIFADNGDGTVTAVIQILYEGEPHKFAWVLPVPGKPDVAISSDQALAALKQATNPFYQLRLQPGSSCAARNAGSAGSAGAPAGLPAMSMASGPSVTVVSSGVIGPYDYATIAVDQSLQDRADAAVKWLTDNEFDVGTLGPDVLRPYLDEGLNLLAFKLTKDSGTGSIRPVMITYESAKPSIPIRPTAVAANDDMGVMVFLLSDKRGIPENYKALELNEALINWFNASSNYNKVVSLAADEAQGQGFVTEFAGKTSSAGVSLYGDVQRDAWSEFQATNYTDPYIMLSDSLAQWGSWEGYNDALQRAVTLPEGVSIEQFKRCMYCYKDDPTFAFDATKYLRDLNELVIKPMSETQALFDNHPYLTRLYTTMSADEMTMDPVFSFNPDLKDVSNNHTATQTTECGQGSDGFVFNEGFRVELPQGGAVHVSTQGAWPIDVTDQPAAFRIMQFGTSGAGKVLEDNSNDINKRNDPPPPTMAPPSNTPAQPTNMGTGGLSGGTGSNAGSNAQANSGNGGEGGTIAIDPGVAHEDDDSGCNVAGARGSDALSLLLLAGLALARRRRAAAS